MRKILNVFLIIILAVAFNVKADMGPPSIAKFELIVSNKNGATCYDEKDNKYIATSKKIDYNKIVYLNLEYSKDYYSVSLKDGNIEGGCIVNLKDLSLKDSSFTKDNTEVTKIEPVNAIVLAGGGLNLRKGPSTMYSKVTLIPEKTIIKLTHQAGDLWYYTEYNGKSGWVNANYIAYDEDYILYDFKDINIYSDNKLTKKIGTIPKLTDITNYVTFNIQSDTAGHYVNYNGIKGYIERLPHKIVGGSIVILREVKLYDLQGKVIKSLKSGTYKYINSKYDYGDYYSKGIYLIDEKGIIDIESLAFDKDYKYSNTDDSPLKKNKGYLGEGLFGEKVTKTTNNDNTGNNVNDDPNKLIDVNDGNTNEIKEELQKQDKINNETIIIIALAIVVLALTVTVIILLVNKKKNNVVNEEHNDYIENNKEEVKIENENQFEKDNEHEE